MALSPCLLFLVFCAASLLTQSLLGSPYEGVSSADVKIGAQISSVWHGLFRGFTADWWRVNNPRNGDRWKNAGLLTLDLSSARLRNLTRALAPAIWRIGGTPEDDVVYVVGNPPECSTNEMINQSLRYPGPLCLTMSRWAEIIDFVKYTQVKLAFGLNGLYQREHPSQSFNSTNAREFLKYTANQGYPVYAFELSNEDNHGQIDPKILADDFGTIRNYINEFWPYDDGRRPLLFGPDVGQHFETSEDIWLASFLDEAASFLNVSTVHTYCNKYTTSVCSSGKVNASGLSTCILPELDFMRIVKKHAPHLNVMAGEAGPHSHGGLDGCTNRFVNSFWYLDVLGSLSAHGVVAFARSTLIGGWYEMVDKTTFQPNPDYFAALLWGELMGTVQLNVTISNSRSLHAYASCTTDGVTLLLLNPDQTETIVTVSGLKMYSRPDAPEQEEYHVRAHDNNPFSNECEILLTSGEWKVLQSADDGTPPEIFPVTRALQPISVPPMSYAFIHFPRSTC